VARLARVGAIALEPTIPAAIEGDDQLISRRSVQRRFVRVTGMTQARLRQIARARYAAKLLRAGSPILDVVQRASYFDQAHLTRSLQQFVGQTPAALLREDAQLSFSYETEPR
jgi:methylphosphotriester-DNA--protein-cysteine methyltransferase